jgi:hypothetical protein
MSELSNSTKKKYLEISWDYPYNLVCTVYKRNILDEKTIFNTEDGFIHFLLGPPLNLMPQERPISSPAPLYDLLCSI